MACERTEGGAIVRARSPEIPRSRRRRELLSEPMSDVCRFNEKCKEESGIEFEQLSIHGRKHSSDDIPERCFVDSFSPLVKCGNEYLVR